MIHKPNTDSDRHFYHSVIYMIHKPNTDSNRHFYHSVICMIHKPNTDSDRHFYHSVICMIHLKRTHFKGCQPVRINLFFNRFLGWRAAGMKWMVAGPAYLPTATREKSTYKTGLGGEKYIYSPEKYSIIGLCVFAFLYARTCSTQTGTQTHTYRHIYIHTDRHTDIH